nr:MAG TPA: hypothetical protein [Caudoviricetes sp.]
MFLCCKFFIHDVFLCFVFVISLSLIILYCG